MSTLRWFLWTCKRFWQAFRMFSKIVTTDYRLLGFVVVFEEVLGFL